MSLTELWKMVLMSPRTSRLPKLWKGRFHLALEHHVGHLAGGFGGIGVVAVYHEVALGVDLPEHAADDIALALLVFVAHHGAGFSARSAVPSVELLSYTYTTASGRALRKSSTTFWMVGASL